MKHFFSQLKQLMKNLLLQFKQLMLDRGWIVSIPIIAIWLIIWIWPGLQIPPVVTAESNGLIRENTQTLFLLSSIAQAFAAILALVFTVSLIAFQLFASYSQRLYGRFFDRFTVTYIAGFIVVILFAIFLTIDPEPTGVKICLSLASACLLVLIPYIMNLKLKFSANQLMYDLEKQAIREYSRSIKKEPEAVSIMENIVSRACALKDYDTVEAGLRAFVNTLGNMQIKEDEKGIDLLDRVSDKTGRRIMRILDNNAGDNLVPEVIRRNLRRLGMSGVRVRSYDVISASVGYLLSVVDVAVRTENEDLGGFSLDSYTDIIQEWAKSNFEGLPESLKKQEEIDWVLWHLKDIGNQAIQKKMDFISSHALSCISSIADTLLDVGLTDSSVSSIKLLGEMGVSVASISSHDAELACYWLARTGAKSIIRNEAGITKTVILSINSIKKVIGRKAVEDALAIANKYKERDLNFKTAYDDFVKMYQNQL